MKRKVVKRVIAHMVTCIIIVMALSACVTGSNPVEAYDAASNYTNTNETYCDKPTKGSGK